MEDDRQNMGMMQYALQMRPLLRKKALFSDETEMFRIPMEPNPGDLVTIRFRTAKNNADMVSLIHEGVRMPMTWQECRDDFDYYGIQILLGKDIYSYTFEVRLGSTCCFYDRFGVSQTFSDEHPFRILPGFSTPDWAKGAVMYQIFTDRFCDGDPSNNVKTDEYSYIDSHVKEVTDWHRMPEAMDVRNFYGGDLQGIIDKLDYLQDLGVQVLYLNPVFVSPSNHKYDTQDYDYIDPHFGRIVSEEEGLLEADDNDNTHARQYISRVTGLQNLEESNQLFAELVRQLHARGMRIILDGVFNHCGSFNKWMDRERIYEGRPGYEPGAYISEDSPYNSYFRFSREGEWPYNKHYEGWWGHITLPKLNYEESEKLQSEILRIAKKWVSPPYNADGWRLDVAADLGYSQEFNHDFWKRFRREVKKARPDALILAEHYGDPMPWLQGDEWDTVMNYDAFMEPVSWFLTGMEKHSDYRNDDLWGNDTFFADAMKNNMYAFSMPSLLTAMNELDNHDHSRFLTRTNHRCGRMQELGSAAASENVQKAVLQEAVVMQMTWPGAPTLYYGDEAGVCGFTDPDNRRPYPWGYEDQDLLGFYRAVIWLHREHKVLRTGSLVLLHREHNVLVYARFDRDEQIIIGLNNRDELCDVRAEVLPAGLSRIEEEIPLNVLFRCGKDGYNRAPSGKGAECETVTVRTGTLDLHMDPMSAVILCHTGNAVADEEGV